MDPCVFIHYSDSNIRQKSLLEAMQSPMFMAYHDGQPFNDNMLRPCPMLENTSDTVNPGTVRNPTRVNSRIPQPRTSIT